MERRSFLHLLASSVLLPSVPALGCTDIEFPLLSDDDLLDDLQRRACLYFVEQASPTTGQVLDRAAYQNPTGNLDPRRLASVSATGYGLGALCIADSRGFQPHAQIVEQVRRTLNFHLNTLPNDHGFFSHFNDIETGVAAHGSEISTIDSAIFFCGVLTARAYFHDDAEIVKLATALYNRIEWPYMLNGPDNGKTCFSMGVLNGKFLASRWNTYCELMMLYLLAIGSPTHPVNPGCWNAWARPRLRYDAFDYISGSDPIFVHQYSHAWFDFRNKRDAYANYFDNSVAATKAHQAFCLALGKPYSQDYWGISASDSAHGYTAWGGPSSTGSSFGGVDGSVVPNATAGSLPFLPDACLRAQRALKANYPQATGRYGLCDAFHPQANWYDPDVLGIDLGISVIMAENYRSGLIWSTFQQNPEVATAFQRAGFH
jgi:hypothetical protein